MKEHMHEWEAIGNYSGGSDGARCKVFVGRKRCSAELSYEQVDARLNATERLSAEDAKFAAVIIRDVAATITDIDTTSGLVGASALEAYANILESDV